MKHERDFLTELIDAVEELSQQSILMHQDGTDYLLIERAKLSDLIGRELF